MKSIEIKANPRTGLGKKDARNLRNEGHVPCVLYGGDEILHFHAHENVFNHLVYTHHVYLVDLIIGDHKKKAIVKDVQMHPVSDKILHIDFQEVYTDKEIIVGLPVEITGSSIGIKAGGKLRQRLRYVKVKGLIENLPDSLVIDITDLEIGQSVQASDLSYDKMEILEPPYAFIVGVVSSRVAAKSMEEEAAEEEAGEEAEAESGEGEEEKE
jgi:large subunit ribosomal protein L25